MRAWRKNIATKLAPEKCAQGKTPAFTGVGHAESICDWGGRLAKKENSGAKSSFRQWHPGKTEGEPFSQNWLRAKRRLYCVRVKEKIATKLAPEKGARGKTPALKGWGRIRNWPPQERMLGQTRDGEKGCETHGAKEIGAAQAPLSAGLREACRIVLRLGGEVG